MYLLTGSDMCLNEHRRVWLRNTMAGFVYLCRPVISGDGRRLDPHSLLSKARWCAHQMCLAVYAVDAAKAAFAMSADRHDHDQHEGEE
jgi:hypothetical protein